MTDKTKAKIEAMADEKEQYCWCAGPTCSGCADNACKLIYAGATPWAEWCERFEKKLKRLKQINIPINVYDRRQMIDEILKEYRQWLEEK